MSLSPEDFGATFQSFMKRMAEQAPAEDPFFVRRLRAHFSHEPTALPTQCEGAIIPPHPVRLLALDMRGEGFAEQARAPANELVARHNRMRWFTDVEEGP